MILDKSTINRKAGFVSETSPRQLSSVKTTLKACSNILNEHPFKHQPYHKIAGYVSDALCIRALNEYLLMDVVRKICCR